MAKPELPVRRNPVEFREREEQVGEGASLGAEEFGMTE